MKYSDTISHKDEYQQEMTHQRIIHTGNSYQKTEWQEMETYGVRWHLLLRINKRTMNSLHDETDIDKK